jgi:hypothetical protein
LAPDAYSQADEWLIRPPNRPAEGLARPHFENGYPYPKRRVMAKRIAKNFKD